MTWSSALVAGVVGTLVMTTMLRVAAEMGVTRMDIALLLGTTVTGNRRKAKAVGYLFHFGIGVAFGFAYAFFFAAVNARTWWLGALVGALHGVFFSTIVMNVLLPVVHPRMATSETAANEVAVLEPPGFLLHNYGHRTFLVTLLAHIAYGAAVGLIVRI